MDLHQTYVNDKPVQGHSAIKCESVKESPECLVPSCDCVCSAIPEENVGHKMLAKMGWKEGDSLGKTNTGILEPVSSSTQYFHHSSCYFTFLIFASLSVLFSLSDILVSRCHFQQKMITFNSLNFYSGDQITDSVVSAKKHYC